MTASGGGTYFSGDAFGLPFSVKVDTRDVATQSAELSGTAVPGAVVLVNGTQQVTADATTGAWKATVSGLKLGETNHIPVSEYVQQDGTWNQKQDRVADVNFELTNLTAEVDRGTVSTEAQVTGVAEPGAVIEVRDATGKLVSSAPTTGPLGSYTVSIPAPNAAGDYPLTVSQVFAGQSIGQVPVTIPYGAAVTVSTPSDGAAHNGGSLIMMGFGAAGSKIVVTDKSTSEVVGSTDVLVNNAWNLSTDSLSDSEHKLIVTQTSAGKNVTKQEITINPGKSTVEEPTADVRFDADVTKKAVVSGGGADGATITVKDGAKELGDTTVEDGKWSLEIDPIGAGKHTLTIEQTGIDGTQTTTVVADYGDAVAITSPSASTITPGTITVSGTGQNGAKITTTVGDQSAEATVENGTWSTDIEVPGSKTPATITVEQHSKGDLRTTAEVTVNPDGPQTPTPVVISEPSTNTYTPGERTVVVGTATPYATIEVRNQWNTVLTTTTAKGDGSWSFARQYGPSAVYTLTATQTRLDGTTSASSPFTLAPLGAFKPLKLETPALNATYQPGEAMLFRGTATPGARIVATSSWGSKLFETRASQTDGSWATTRAFGPSATYVVTLTQTAADGTTDSITPIVLTPPKGHQDVILTAPKAGDKYTPGVPVMFTGTATPGAKIEIKSRLSGNVLTSTTADADGNWTKSRAFGPTAVYNLDIVATDPDGTTSSTGLDDFGPATD